MVNGKKKGNSYELAVAKIFKELGWDCVTSRSESKRMDDAGVDLCYTDPFYIQCKAVEKFGTYHDTLTNMPDKKGKFNLIFHKRNRKGTVVVMTQEHFLKILDLLMKGGIVKP